MVGRGLRVVACAAAACVGVPVRACVAALPPQAASDDRAESPTTASASSASARSAALAAIAGCARAPSRDAGAAGGLAAAGPLARPTAARRHGRAADAPRPRARGRRRPRAGGVAPCTGVVAGRSSSARSSASTNAAAVAVRSSGSFAMPAPQHPVDGRRQRRVALARVRRLVLDVLARLGGEVRAVNGARRSSSSNAATASAVAVAGAGRLTAERLLRRQVGGGAEQLAAAGDRVLARAAGRCRSRRRAGPRSRSSRKFAGLMSRCTIPRSCAWSSAEAASRSQRTRLVARDRVATRSASATVPPARYSMTMNALRRRAAAVAARCRRCRRS